MVLPSGLRQLGAEIAKAPGLEGVTGAVPLTLGVAEHEPVRVRVVGHPLAHRASLAAVPYAPGTEQISLARIHNLSISLDGYATGQGRSLEAPMGHAGQRLAAWLSATRFDA